MEHGEGGSYQPHCRAQLVARTISLVIHDPDSHLNVPSAPMPIPDTDQTSAMHPALVTELTLSKPILQVGRIDSSFD